MMIAESHLSFARQLYEQGKLTHAQIQDAVELLAHVESHTSGPQQVLYIKFTKAMLSKLSARGMTFASPAPAARPDTYSLTIDVSPRLAALAERLIGTLEKAR